MVINGYATMSEISDTSTPSELCVVVEHYEHSDMGEREEMWDISYTSHTSYNRFVRWWREVPLP
jgi:hypothetical protein